MNEKHNSRMNEDTIDLLEIWYLFLQKFKFIVLAAVIGGLVVGAYTHFRIAPKYQATSKIYIVSASSDSVVNLTDLQIGTSLTADYTKLVLSRPMLESTIKNLNLEDISVKDLKNMVSVSNPSGTRILEITATSTIPEQATQIANEMARLARVWLPEVMETNEPNIIESAIVPTSKSSPSLAKNTFLGALALALIYFAVEVVKFLMDDTIRAAEDMERYFGLIPFAVIPESEELNDGSADKKSGRKVKLVSSGKNNRRQK